MIVQVLAFAFLALLVYRLFLSPLARLPGPTVCALTRIPLMYHEFHGKRRTFIHNLHLKYGPVVRIAPDEVAFASREAAKEIYASGGSGYDKSRFYHLFANYDTPNMFSTLEKGEHADIKKRFAERYSKMHIMSHDVASIIQDHAEAFANKLSENLGTSVDIYYLLHCFSLDGISNLLFYPKGTSALLNTDDQKIMKEVVYSTGLRRQFFQHNYPLLSRVYRKLTGKGGKRAGNPQSALSEYILNTSRSASVASHTVLAKLRAADASLDNPPPNLWKYTASECMDHLVAGIDTTGASLSFLLHALSLPTPSAQAIQARLHAELLSHPSRTPQDVDALPYLDAVVKEGLRVFAPIPMSFPRLVPKGGRTIDGVALPAGTIVSCQPYSMHRLDTAVFPDPDTFVPERWLDPEAAAERNQLFFAFAAGGRGCIGKHLALLEMKMLLKEVYSTYRSRVAPDMTTSMECDDQTISTRPKGQKCLLVFEKYDGA